MLSLHLITSDNRQEVADIQSVNCDVSAGPVKILPHHAPMVATLKPGKIYTVKADGIKAYEILSPGLLKVQDNIVTVVS